jgi:O-6-methylguanine DNA methyltransferase
MVGPRLPWDVPVVLHAGDAADLREVTTLDVRLEVALPGVDGVRLTTGRLGGRTVLCGIDPLRGDGDGRGDLGGSAGAGGLGVALLALGRPVPVLAVGTELERRVLAALADVPAGGLVTYGELAARAGAPGAARAAARVMATNRVPLVLPCHRVVPAGRGTGAYGWGAEVKAALLALEGAGPARSGVEDAS